MATALRTIPNDTEAEPIADFFIFDVETANPAPEDMKRLEAEFMEDWEPSRESKRPRENRSRESSRASKIQG